MTLGLASDERGPQRPLLRWHGGKWLLAPWIISHFPAHRVYVEPFGGAASVLMRKPRAYAEIYNDLDDMVVNLFRVLRDPAKSDRLRETLRLTPFSRTEFDAARKGSSDPVERARRLVIRSFMGFSAGARAGRSTGFRSNAFRTGTHPALDWKAFPGHLPALVDRLSGVVIENRDACEVLAQQDSAETLHYVDPPYVAATRSVSSRRAYRHEIGDSGHRRLLDMLGDLKGMVVLSGYRASLYDEALIGWTRLERATHADGGRPRVECLWLNRAAAARAQQPTLFGDAA